MTHMTPKSQVYSSWQFLVSTPSCLREARSPRPGLSYWCAARMKCYKSFALHSAHLCIALLYTARSDAVSRAKECGGDSDHSPDGAQLETAMRRSRLLAKAQKVAPSRKRALASAVATLVMRLPASFHERLLICRPVPGMTHELTDLKDEVQAMLAASKDRKSWRKDIDEATAKGLSLLQDAKAALEVQSQIFQKADGSQADDKWLKETVTGLSNCTQSFHADLLPKFEDVANSKLTHSKKRREYLGQPVRNLEQSLLVAEGDILKSITKLAAEVEVRAF